MTMKLSASRFRIRRPDPVVIDDVSSAEHAVSQLFDNADDGFGGQTFPTARQAIAALRPANTAPMPQSPMNDTSAATDIDAIKREGLTGRQLRLARRVAQKQGLPATSDFDAVRLLRIAGIDPFQRNAVLELVPNDTAPRAETVQPRPAPGSIQLPQTIKPVQVPSTELRAEQNHAAEIMKMQRDLSRRRRRRAMLLMARLGFFVALPALLCGFYFYFVATPLYATKSEFIIQQADNPAAGGGMGGLLRGTSLATSQDSIAVQGYLQSRDAMKRLDADMGFRAHFSADGIDPITRLDPGATAEAAYKTYAKNVKIAYDPTEGIIKMEVIAADPATSQAFAEHLISYAEEQVDQLTQRLRADQMQGARENFELNEKAMLDATRRVVDLQERYKVLSSEAEVSLITTQIGQLETQLSADRLSLQQMESNENPNQARMDPVKRRIVALESEIAAMRAKLTTDGASGTSLAQVQGDLLVAQADAQTRQMLLSQSLQSMQTAQMEANRQVRYLSVSVNPIAPDEPTYPRPFENTLVALLIFAGIYLMISMTAAILREQVSA